MLSGAHGRLFHVVGSTRGSELAPPIQGPTAVLRRPGCRAVQCRQHARAGQVPYALPRRRVGGPVRVPRCVHCAYDVIMTCPCSLLGMLPIPSVACGCVAGMNTLVLRKRRGFIKLALEAGAHIVPVYSFNENDACMCSSYCQPNPCSFPCVTLCDMPRKSILSSDLVFSCEA
jgi:hypothetical protein